MENTGWCTRTLATWRNIVKTCSICQIVISTTFWIWALVNILRKQTFNLGVISFLFPLCAGIFGCLSTRSKTIFNATRYFELTLFGHFVVTLNYALGAVISYDNDNYTEGFFMYCTISTMLWFISWIYLSQVALRWRNEVRDCERKERSESEENTNTV